MADATVSISEQLYRLICDFALDLEGRPDGLTAAEMRRVWVARHRCALPRRAIDRLSDLGLVCRHHRRRTCVLTGEYRAPWVPVSVEVACS